MTWVVELTHSAGARRFSMGGGLALSDADYIDGGLRTWDSPTQKIDISKDGVVQTSADTGQIVILNMPRSAFEAGPLDDVVDLIWQNRQAVLYWVVDSWASRVKVAQGTLQQPAATMFDGTSAAPSITFLLKDPRSSLNVPLQPTKFSLPSILSSPSLLPSSLSPLYSLPPLL